MASARAAQSIAPAKITTPAGLTIKAWDPNSSNTQDVQGHVLLGGKPVAGVAVRINGWVAPITDKSGAFTYPVDITMPDRHVVTVASATGATIDGQPLTAAQRAAVLAAGGGFSVGYRVSEVSTKLGAGGTVVLSGRLTYGKAASPQPVGLYSYLLKGKITYADGTPVPNAIVTTRTADHKFWTFSRPTGANGVYTAFLVAADQLGSDPVPMTVGIAVGKDSYAEPLNDFVDFAKLKSSTLDVQLPAAAGGALVKTTLTPQATAGAVYQGLLVGVVGKGRAITPISATWPDANGRFQIVLPASAHSRLARWR